MKAGDSCGGRGNNRPEERLGGPESEAWERRVRTTGFPGSECRCWTAGGRAGIQAEQEDPRLGGESRSGRNEEQSGFPAQPSGSTFLFPKRALTAARTPRTRQARSIEPPAAAPPHHPLAAFDAFGARDPRGGAGLGPRSPRAAGSGPGVAERTRGGWG